MTRTPAQRRPWRQVWRHWWRRRHRRPVAVSARRHLLVGAAGAVALGALLLWRRLGLPAAEPPRRGAPIRPPTAAPDDAAFRAACIACGLCGTVCENGCIRFFAADELTWGPLTPYVDVRRRSCTLCMRCSQICPTSALVPVPRDMEQIVARVHMGLAVVDPDRCLSYLGRVCGYCHDACPLPQKAIKLAPPGKPVVIAEGCVGCGRCVELCPQRPTAIDVDRRALNVDRRALSVDRRALSVDRRALSVDRRALSVDRRALSVDRRALNVDRRAL